MSNHLRITGPNAVEEGPTERVEIPPRRPVARRRGGEEEGVLGVEPRAGFEGEGFAGEEEREEPRDEGVDWFWRGRGVWRWGSGAVDADGFAGAEEVGVDLVAEFAGEAEEGGVWLR